ncbi:hypothetical protein M4914_22975 [Streptomyces somaliensis DSM 40738]|uniref:hypothetical protein n=1 Tax=Streptomyces somaliensis TaxID=78355 RepID=UPI0021C4A0B1|nr:hypothetical protein [Streptomyces somaliensis]MCQ0025514.1 hypothetical protein [Streptomyces somaliensis DSM 40738]
MRRTPRDQLAVVSQSGPTVTFFDAATHEPLEVLQVPGEPHELCFDPGGGCSTARSPTGPATTTPTPAGPANWW